MAILHDASFSSLEYYEYGFARRKSTGTVDTSRVYTYGKYLLGPDFKFKVFPAGSHDVVINNIAAFTSGRGVEVIVSAKFQYFLRRQELHLLHKAYDLNYQDVMRSSAVDAIKRACTDFNKTETFRNRSDVERHMFQAVQTRLGGKCCPEYCRDKPSDCPFECKARDCNDDTERGIFVDVRYFQLGSVRIPDDLQKQMMESILIQERALREDFIQTAQIVRKETDKKVQQIKNNAREVSRLATAQAEYIGTSATASYTNVVETARSRGLTLLYSTLNISQQAHKSSFDYLRALKENKQVHLTVDFQQRIAANAWTHQ
ncbi:uncharacterized protein LOC128212495 isoform X2 [Mya arenaria]|uniref:uncharacterized protein LOC128212495 isoform X2 n=1 Tax=Mya arenaria TaxID=6604 RepID=UPI0022E44293|nr:uncharacterized protein LOC128212495 isoform X2 [Mya arenaria]